MVVAELGPGLSSMSPVKISRSLRLTGVPKKTDHLSIVVFLELVGVVVVVVVRWCIDGNEPVKLVPLAGPLRPRLYLD